VNITGRGLFGKLCVCEHLRQTYATVLPTSRVIFPAKSAKLWVFRRSFASQNGEALCPVTRGGNLSFHARLSSNRGDHSLMSKIEASPRSTRSGSLPNGKALSTTMFFCCVAFQGSYPPCRHGMSLASARCALSCSTSLMSFCSRCSASNSTRE